MRAVAVEEEIEVQRDMDLIRSVLLFVEQDPQLDGIHPAALESTDFPGHSQAQVDYHVKILIKGGFLEGSTMMNAPPVVLSLTWNGHEFIGSISDQGIWEKVKGRIAGLPDVALSVVWELGKSELKKKLGL